MGQNIRVMGCEKSRSPPVEAAPLLGTKEKVIHLGLGLGVFDLRF